MNKEIKEQRDWKNSKKEQREKEKTKNIDYRGIETRGHWLKYNIERSPTPRGITEKLAKPYHLQHGTSGDILPLSSFFRCAIYRESSNNEPYLYIA